MAHYAKYPVILIIIALFASPFVAITSVAQMPAAPSVSITSPVTGSTSPPGREIAIEVSSSDPAGILQLELWINNQLAGQAATSTDQVLPLQMSLMIRWTPPSPGSYTLQARSVNKDGLSPISVPVIITVVPDGQPTPTPAGCIPMITVQARALNVRTGPGATYGLLGRLEIDQTAEITGRNAAGTWWRIDFGTAQGWVSASYVTASCVDGVPVVDQPTPSPTATPSMDIKFWADSTNINTGQCTTLYWEVDNVKAVYFNEGGSDQGVIGHGNKSVCPSATTTYRLIVILVNDQRVEREVTVFVQGSSLNINFRADSTNISYGECTTLRWDVDNAKAVYISDGHQESGVSAHSNAQICPKETTTYHLRAVRWDNREEYRDVKVKVQKGPGTINFWADRTDINKGECTTLRWQVTDVKKVYLNLGQGEQQVNPGGSIDVCPPDTMTYHLRAEWQDGQQSTEDVTITVHQAQPQPIVEFSANPPQIVPGDSSILLWNVNNAKNVYLDDETVEAQGTREVRPEQDTTYTLRVIGLDNSVSEYQVIIRILIVIITPSININANPTDISQGECSNLSWDASHGSEFYINGESVAQNGNKQVCPGQTTDYTFRVVTLGTMDAYRTARVNVHAVAEPTPEPMPMPTVAPPEPQPEPPQPEPTPTEMIIGPGGLPPEEPLIGPGGMPPEETSEIVN